MTDSILDALEPADAQRVLAAGNALRLPQGWSPIAESTPADKAYLITEGEVSVRKGGEVIVARNGKPVAKLVPFPAEVKKKLRLGTWKGRIWMSPDFDAPLSPDELKAWGY